MFKSAHFWHIPIRNVDVKISSEILFLSFIKQNVKRKSLVNIPTSPNT